MLCLSCGCSRIMLCWYVFVFYILLHSFFFVCHGRLQHVLAMFTNLSFVIFCCLLPVASLFCLSCIRCYSSTVVCYASLSSSLFVSFRSSLLSLRRLLLLLHSVACAVFVACFCCRCFVVSANTITTCNRQCHDVFFFCCYSYYSSSSSSSSCLLLSLFYLHSYWQEL